MKKLLLAGLLVSLVLFLSACNPAQDASQKAATGFVGTDITGADFAKPLALTDHTGKKRTMSDFKGKVVTLFFGYTHCPDVCPTTMAELSTVMNELGPLSDQVQVIFVSLDPERDTKQILAQIQKLPTGYRTVINLFIIEGYSHKEIAELLGVSESTSKTQLHKGRHMLQKMLSR